MAKKTADDSPQHWSKRFEFYETPDPFTDWMLEFVVMNFGRLRGPVLEPCAGAGGIASRIDRLADPSRLHRPVESLCFRSDIDPRWDLPIRDATGRLVYQEVRPEWSITNPAFSVAFLVLQKMLQYSTQGVAMYHRATLKEPLKTPGLGRSFFREHPPTATLWCPRFAHRRNDKGDWATDSVTCVWSIWVNGAKTIGDVWPDDSLFLALEQYTPIYRARMDALMAKP